MKKILLSLCFAIVSLGVFAVKAITAPITIIQSDGTPITVLLHGDEDFSWYTDVNGNILERHGNDFTKIAMSKEEFFAKAQRAHSKNIVRRIPIGTRTPAYFPHVGSPKALVILVQFPDTSATDSTSHFSAADPKKTFNDYLNARGKLTDYGLREGRNFGSVYQYFNDMSGGMFKPQFDVVGPYTMIRPESYYGQNSSSHRDINIRELVIDACTAADADVDFSKYDNNGDGTADLVYIIYAGYSESNGAPEDAIWPQAFSVNDGNFDGVKIGFSGVNNELNFYPGCVLSPPYKRINGIGLFCHEFSHTLGLPDLYSGLAVDNQEMEYWDLMDGGEYTDNGYTPTPYTPWEKEVMGWTTLKPLADDSVKVTLAPDSALKINSTTSQYVILHNIQNKGWARKLFGHGMLVYRIDYGTRTSVNMGDMPNKTSGKPGVTIIPADSLLISSYNVDRNMYTNQQYFESQAGDPFPGSQNVDSLLQFTLNDGVVINKPLYKITEEASGDISFYYLKRPSTGTSTGVNAINVVPDYADSRIFTIDGRFVGTDMSVLPKGVYIINHKKIVVGI